MPTARAPRPKIRCAWATSDPLYQRYHDEEWGVPLRGTRALFELLTLEGAQAGLSWLTVLKKREGYRRAFDGFDPARVARYDARKVARLLADPGIVRNRAKVASTIANARVIVELERGGESFTDLLWSFAPKPRRRPRAPGDVPAKTEASDAMSKALKKRGFTFVGSTICYAFMQASGMVDDHVVGCFRAR